MVDQVGDRQVIGYCEKVAGMDDVDPSSEEDLTKCRQKAREKYREGWNPSE